MTLMMINNLYLIFVVKGKVVRVVVLLRVVYFLAAATSKGEQIV